MQLYLFSTCSETFNSLIHIKSPFLESRILVKMYFEHSVIAHLLDHLFVNLRYLIPIDFVFLKNSHQVFPFLFVVKAEQLLGYLTPTIYKMVLK